VVHTKEGGPGYCPEGDVDVAQKIMQIYLGCATMAEIMAVRERDFGLSCRHCIREAQRRWRERLSWIESYGYDLDY
jgi:hypothetical protein